MSGVARFAGGDRVRGEFTLFEGGHPVVESSLGAHAVRDGATLLLGADVASWWGRLEYHWVLEALEAFVTDVLGRAPVKLPPVGVVRLDDAPGTAQHQMQGDAKPDSRQSSRLRSLRVAYGSAGARLNVAVTAEALDGGGRVPLDEVWPDSVAQLRAGVAEESFEPVCHGLLHLVPEKMDAARSTGSSSASWTSRRRGAGSTRRSNGNGRGWAARPRPSWLPPGATARVRWPRPRNASSRPGCRRSPAAAGRAEPA